MNTTPSDNILELRRLSAKLCETNHPDYCKDIIVELQKVVESGKAEVIQEKTTKEKIKCYENMCTNITKLLQKIK
jgi:hypothetical protein